MDIREHLHKRGGNVGEWWTNTRPLEGNKLGKELWLNTNDGWRKIITNDLRLTEFTTNNIEFNSPKIEYGDSIYRVVNRNQLYLDEDGNVFQLSPSTCTRIRRRELKKALEYLAFTEILKFFSDPRNLCAKTREADGRSADMIPKEGIIHGNKRYSLKEIPKLAVLDQNHEAFSILARSVIARAPRLLQQLMYIYNAYLGSEIRPFLTFTDGEFGSSPDLLNFYCNVRSFCPEPYLESTLNYTLNQPVFRTEDIYRRGVDGQTERERAAQFVILEFPFTKNLVQTRVQEITDYNKLYWLLKSIFASHDKLNPQENCIMLSDGYPFSQKADYHTFLLGALKPWSNIFAEVRMYADLIMPWRIYSIDIDWVEDCKYNDSDGVCDVCTRFRKGALLWECSSPKEGTRKLKKYNLMPTATVGKEDLLTGFVYP